MNDDTPTIEQPAEPPVAAEQTPPPAAELPSEPLDAQANAALHGGPIAEIVAGVAPPSVPDTEPDSLPVPAEAVTQDDPAGSEPEHLSVEPDESVPPPSKKKWYVVKVTSGREESIKAAIERRMRIEGLEEFFGQIVIPVERITVVKKVKVTKNGEKVTKEKRDFKEVKKYPGYVMAEVEWNDRILYLFRETSGVGDFVGASGPHKPPVPMTELEVRRMLGEPGGPGADDPKKGPTVVKLDFEKGDKVRIREGMFANTEGEVKEISTPKEAGETPQVTVVVMVFGRPVDVTLDYWQVDKV